MKNKRVELKMLTEWWGKTYNLGENHSVVI